MQIVFQALLILSDLKHRKTCVVSLRSGAFFYVLGMAIILTFLGLLSIWLIVYFSIVEGIHIHLFLTGLKMDNDPYLLYASVW